MATARSRPSVAQLVAEHHQAVYGYAYRLTGSVHDAEDLTQQVFLVALRKMSQIRNMDSVKSWLFAVLRSCFLRDRQRRRPALATDVSLGMESVSSLALMEGADKDGLQAALNRLPETHRLVVVMFYFEECSYREIAKKLEIPIGTVMSRLTRARHNLRSFLLESEHGERERPTVVAAEQG